MNSAPGSLAPPDIAAQTDSMNPLTQMLLAEFQRVNQRLDRIESRLAAHSRSEEGRTGLFLEEDREPTAEEKAVFNAIFNAMENVLPRISRSLDQSAEMLCEIQDNLRGLQAPDAAREI